MLILFHEQAEYERGTKMENIFLEIDGNTMAIARRGDNVVTVQKTEAKCAHLYCSKNSNKRDCDGF